MSKKEGGIERKLKETSRVVVLVWLSLFVFGCSGRLKFSFVIYTCWMIYMLMLVCNLEFILVGLYIGVWVVS